MSTMRPKPDEEPIELDEEPRERGTLVDDLDFPEERRGIRAWLPWILGVLAFATTIAVLLALEGGINRFVHRFRAKERAEEQGQVVYSAGSKDVVPNVVFVDSHPPGAFVRIDGKTVGKTPLIIQHHLDGKSVLVQLDADGRRSWRKRVPVVGGGIHVEVKLKK